MEQGLDGAHGPGWAPALPQLSPFSSHSSCSQRLYPPVISGRVTLVRPSPAVTSQPLLEARPGAGLKCKGHAARVQLSSSSALRPFSGQLSLELSVTRLLALCMQQTSPWLSGALGEEGRPAV